MACEAAWLRGGAVRAPASRRRSPPGREMAANLRPGGRIPALVSRLSRAIISAKGTDSAQDTSERLTPVIVPSRPVGEESVADPVFRLTCGLAPAYPHHQSPCKVTARPRTDAAVKRVNSTASGYSMRRRRQFGVAVLGLAALVLLVGGTGLARADFITTSETVKPLPSYPVKGLSASIPSLTTQGNTSTRRQAVRLVPRRSSSERLSSVLTPRGTVVPEPSLRPL